MPTARLAATNPASMSMAEFEARRAKTVTTPAKPGGTLLGQAQRKARVLIVDDHPMVRHGLAELINEAEDLEVCGEAPGAAEALRLVQTLEPELAIVDISLADGDGIELIQNIRGMQKNTRVLVTSMHDETLFAERALHAGAMGYINKAEATNAVVDAMRTILRGKMYVSERMAERMLMHIADFDRNAEKDPIQRLSNRELQVFQLIGEGYTTRKIAEHLHLSIKTIETHRASIKRKLNLETASELTRRAVQWVLEEASRA